VRTSRSAREPDYNLLDSDALENEKELLLRKIAQVDAILRQKPMSRENRSLESEGLLELTTPVSYQEVNGASAKPASAPNLRTSKAWQGRQYSSGLRLLDNLNRRKVTVWSSFLWPFRRPTLQLCAVYLPRAIGANVELSKAIEAIKALKGCKHLNPDQ
jgi:hypothetical protein